MAKYSLTVRPALDGYDKEYDGVTLREQLNLGIVCIAVADGEHELLGNEMRDCFGLSLPQIGHSCANSKSGMRLLKLQTNQFFCIFDSNGHDAATTLSHRLGPVGYYTDQSDSWAVICMAGSECRRTLARMCMIDLDETSFPADSIARTSIEHMAVIIIADTAESYILLTPRSSALSFVHALESAV